MRLPGARIVSAPGRFGFACAYRCSYAGGIQQVYRRCCRSGVTEPRPMVSRFGCPRRPLPSTAELKIAFSVEKCNGLGASQKRGGKKQARAVGQGKAHSPIGKDRQRTRGACEGTDAAPISELLGDI